MSNQIDPNIKQTLKFLNELWCTVHMQHSTKNDGNYVDQLHPIYGATALYTFLRRNWDAKPRQAVISRSLTVIHARMNFDFSSNICIELNPLLDFVGQGSVYPPDKRRAERRSFLQKKKNFAPTGNWQSAVAKVLLRHAPYHSALFSPSPAKKSFFIGIKLDRRVHMGCQ